MPPLQSDMARICATHTNKTMAPRIALRGIIAGLTVNKISAFNRDLIDRKSKVCEKDKRKTWTCACCPINRTGQGDHGQRHHVQLRCMSNRVSQASAEGRAWDASFGPEVMVVRDN